MIRNIDIYAYLQNIKMLRLQQWCVWAVVKSIESLHGGPHFENAQHRRPGGSGEEPWQGYEEVHTECAFFVNQ